MGRKGAIAVAVILAVAAIGIVITLLQPRQQTPDDDGGTIIANDTEPAEIVSVASARSAFPFVQRWVSQYNNENPQDH